MRAPPNATAFPGGNNEVRVLARQIRIAPAPLGRTRTQAVRRAGPCLAGGDGGIREPAREKPPGHRYRRLQGNGHRCVAIGARPRPYSSDITPPARSTPAPQLSCWCGTPDRLRDTGVGVKPACCSWQVPGLHRAGRRGQHQRQPTAGGGRSRTPPAAQPSGDRRLTRRAAPSPARAAGRWWQARCSDRAARPRQSL